MIQQIDHVNLVVRDLNAMSAFYRHVLGFRLTKEATISGAWIEDVVGLADVVADVQYLDLPQGPRIELIHYQSPVGRPGVGFELPNKPGIRHLAFRVTDIDALCAKLRDSAVTLLSPVATVPDAQVTYAGGVRKRLVYFRDPEENLLEFCEYA
ncbi:MAG: VOC family protein [Planctomycetales bacterium]|nr:VOC family protein [Planctomycetales bacterium]